MSSQATQQSRTEDRGPSETWRHALMDPQTASGIMQQAWRGATGGVTAAAILIAALTGAFFWSGLGTPIDVLIGAAAGVICVAVFAAVTLGVVAIANRLPRYFLAGLGGAMGAIITAEAVDFGWPDALFYPGLFVFVWTQAVLAGALWVIVTGELKQVTRRRQVVVLALLLGALGINGMGVIWLADAGTPPEPVAAAPPAAPPVSSLESNPSEPGDYAIRTLFYGSGTDIQRPEYGANVDLRTASVDGSLILPEWEGFTADVRAWYWGFGIENLPINGRVWMPEGDGPFPLVLIAHGNHAMQEYSDPGYAYLGELLASRGFITVSIDENFINGSWSGDFGGDEVPARAWLLLKHLEQWRQWNATEGSPFYRRVDMDRIALVGHSRGGEAVPLAARFNTLPAFPDNTDLTFDFGFQLKSLVALAPTDYRYERRIALQDISYLTLQGSYDSDERSFFGIRQYQRISFSDEFDGFKAGLYIHRANHGQFNSVWGATDTGPPSSWLLNTEPLIDGSSQRQVAKLYIAAFMEATLRGRTEYVPLFRNHRAAGAWLPETAYVHRYSDPSYRPIATYEEDLDVTTASLEGSTIQTRHLTEWSEQDLPFRGERTQQTHAVLLGWGEDSATGATSSKQAASAADTTAAYTIVLPDTSRLVQQLADDASLVFSMARRLGDEGDENASSALAGADSDAFDVYLEFTDAEGTTVTRALRQFAVVPPVLKTQFLKIKWLSRDRFGMSWEPVMQTYEVPLGEFADENQAFNPSGLRRIGFTFDRRVPGHIALDDIGFRGR